MSLAQTRALRRCESCGEALAGLDRPRCPSCGHDFGIAQADTLGLTTGPEPNLLSVPEMRYQNAYVWLVLISALDVMLTMVVLVALNGFEVNPVAAAVIQTMGFPGATAFKFSVVLLVVIICEIVGRKDDRTGRNLSRAAILISALPVAYSFALIFLASNA